MRRRWMSCTHGPSPLKPGQERLQFKLTRYLAPAVLDTGHAAVLIASIGKEGVACVLVELSVMEQG